MNLIPFKPEHLTQINPRGIDLNNFDMFVENIKDHHEKDKESKFFSIATDGKIAACGGVYSMWPGVGEMWLTGSDLIKTKPIAFHKACIKGVKDILNIGKWHRIQSVVRADFPEGIGWNKLLGFKVEALMKKYTPDGVDCFLYRLGGL